MEPRPLSEREREVLQALLAADVDGFEQLRQQVTDLVVVGECGCGCPSVDFQHAGGRGMPPRSNAQVRGSVDGLFLYTYRDEDGREGLGGIEWVGVSDTKPLKLPGVEALVVTGPDLQLPC